ncbi:MAG: hypothetical protein R3F14_31485 [Polyangiaceae bacterium]
MLPPQQATPPSRVTAQLQAMEVDTWTALEPCTMTGLIGFFRGSSSSSPPALMLAM